MLVFTKFDWVCLFLGIIGIGLSIYGLYLCDWSVYKMFFIEEDDE